MRFISKYSVILVLMVAIYSVLHFIYAINKGYLFQPHDDVNSKFSNTYQLNWNNYVSPVNVLYKYNFGAMPPSPVFSALSSQIFVSFVS